MTFALMPHGSCYFWDPWLTSLHVSTDLAIALSYFAITAQLTVFLRKYPQPWLGKYRLITYGFILFCGLGHALSAWNVWHSNYWSEGTLKLAIAIVSWGAVWAVQVAQLRAEDVIAELDQAESQRQLLQTVLETDLDGLMVFEAIRDTDNQIVDFRYTLLNSAAVALVGRDDLVGERLLEIVPSHRDNGLFEAYCRVTETGIPIEDEFEYAGAEYQNRWFRNRASKLNDGFVVSFTEISDYKRLEAQLRQQANLDPLTGALNRSALDDIETDSCDAVLFIDLDKFKAINDRAGHKVGDAVLVEVTQRIQATVRPEDRVIRWGGDEFVILLNRILDDGTSVANGTAQRIVSAIEQPLQIGIKEYLLGASVGVYAPVEKCASAERAVRCADAAMYEAKQARKQNLAMPAVMQFDEAILSRIRERDYWEQALRQAIDEEQLVLYYQPIVDLQQANMPIVGFEALLRWHHPEHGCLYPDFFIPLAERSGLIHVISRYVLRKAYAQAAKWSSLERPIKMGINLCTDDLGHSAFLSALKEVLQQDCVSSGFIFFEITETSMADIAIGEIRAAASQIKELGGRLSLDDFGTGRNTLCCLQWRVFDAIKIDRSFVSGAEAMPEICQLVAALAHALNLEVVAEGVETAEQMEMLRSFGIEYAQGYYFSKPQPPAEVEQAWL